VKERRGAGLLIAGALAMVAVAGAIVWWGTHREQRHSVLVFHWIPGPAPLRVLGAPPWAGMKGENIEDTLDPRLLNLLRETAIGGELRMVTELFTPKPHAGALLLNSLPESPFSLNLVDRRAAVYIERGAGFAVFPDKSPPLGTTIALTPDKPLTMFTFLTTDPQGGGSSGVTLATWW
jgi:hypothetical protein